MAGAGIVDRCVAPDAVVTSGFPTPQDQPGFCAMLALRFPNVAFSSQSGALIVPAGPPLGIASAENKAFIVAVLRRAAWQGLYRKGIC